MEAGETKIKNTGEQRCSFVAHVYGPRARMMIVLCATVAYLLAFSFLYRIFGHTVAALTLLPVATAGWFFGLRAGLIVALLFIPLNALMFMLHGSQGWVVVTEHWPDVITGLSVGVVIAWLNDLITQVRKQSHELACERESLKKEISLRSRVEEALRRERDFAENLIETAPVFVLVLDAEGRIIRFNSHWEEFSGYSREEMEGMEWATIFAPESHQEMVREKIARTFDNIQTSGVNSVIVKDGSKYQVEWHAKRLMDSEGRKFGLLAVGMDITERKLAEQALQQSEERYHQMFETNQAVKLLVDPETMCIVDGNRAACEFYGYSRDEICGKKISDINTLSEQEVSENLNLAKSVQRLNFSFRHRLASGEIRDVEVFAGPVLTTGKTLIYSIVQDVTERKRAEEALKNAHDELDRRVEERTTELAMVIGTLEREIGERKRMETELRASHEKLRDLTAHLESVRERERIHIAREVHDELGQSLTALKFDLSWLKNRLQEKNTSLMDKIRSMGEVVDATIRSVQRISSELRPRLLDDLGLAAAIEWQVNEFTRRSGILCNMAIDADRLSLSQERSTALFRIFQEALTNILRHANATEIDISLAQTGETVMIEVADNGNGIKENEAISSQSFGLMGMRERAHLCGGELDIKGVPGEGTTVRVSIPMQGKEADDDKDPDRR